MDNSNESNVLINEICENDKMLVRDLLKTVNMGSLAIDVTREYVLSPTFGDYLKGLESSYNSFNDRCVEFMRDHHIPEDVLASVKEALQRGAIKLGMKGTRSDEKVAEQLLKGSTMGIDVIGKNLNMAEKYSPELKNLAEEIESFLEKSVKELRQWLS